MSYQSDIMQALLGSAEVSAICGGNVFADVADGSAAPPYVTFEVVSTGGETCHDGDRGVEFPLIQFNCWAARKADAVALAKAIHGVLDGNTIEGTSEASFQFSNQFGTYESDTKLFGEIIEYRAACNLT